MWCKIVRSVYVAQYYEVNQKSKKLRFYIIVIVANPCDAQESY